ncbi:MAG: ABC transporter permease [SAR324 cluster bacterium]|nr:ABC transporter permease [SAR324 cluster bacterium]
MPWIIRFCFGFIFLFILFALFGEFLTDHSYRNTFLLKRLLPPFFWGGDAEFLLGTDHKGRDLLARLAMGARISLIVAILGTVIGAVFGSLLGMLAAARRGLTESVIMAAVDVQASLPIIIVALFVLAIFDTDFTLFILLVGLVGWEVYARLMRGATLSAKEQGYVLAVRALGASQMRIYFRHILPNIFNVLIVQFTVNLPLTILLETALSFLGLGVQPPLTSLGQIMSDGRDRLLTAWWLTMFPGILIFCVALSISLLGDWLRDRLDPTL